MVLVSLFCLKKKKRVDWESEKIIIDFNLYFKRGIESVGRDGGGKKLK
jgi:hypothetical protein